MDQAQLIKDIKSRLPLSSVIKNAVALRGRGHNFIGLCPFHEEKTPSFHVRDQAARFKCFGCGASGDAFEFVMRLRGISFPEALTELAAMASVDISSPKGKPAPKIPKGQDELLFAQQVAQDFFTQEIRDEKNGAAARRYLIEERGLSEKMIRQAALGFGGTSKDRFFSFLKKHGLSAKIALEAGLIKQGQFSETASFLGRITFPIRNFSGQIIAFGGRAFLEEGAGIPKYVNTHRYAHFEKRKQFYGLFESKSAILKGKTPVLVEGYFDAMALWALGTPALASCGTALSRDHIAPLSRLSKRIIVCFDSDEAGHTALKHALLELYQHEITSSLVVLEKKDPGSYLADRDLDSLKKILAAPIDGLCYLIERSAVLAQDNVSEHMRQLDELLPIFASIKRPLLRRQYVSHLAQHLHEDASLLWAEVESRIKTTKPVKKSPSAQAQAQKTEPRALSANEKLLLEILLAKPDLLAEMDDIWPSIRTDSRAFIERVAELVNKGLSLDDGNALKAVFEIGDRDHWFLLVSFMRDRVALSGAEAVVAIRDLKTKLEQKKAKESLRNMRLRLQDFEKKKDFPSVLESLKEHSAILFSSKTKLGDEKPKIFSDTIEQKQGAEPSREQGRRGVGLNQKIHALDEEILFDSDDDWL